MIVRPFNSALIAFVVMLALSTSAWSAETPAQEAAPAPAQEKPMEADTPTDQSAVQIKDTVVCQDVVDRAPVGSGDVFAKESAKLYCYSRVVGALTDTEVTHNWYYKGTLKSSVKLAVRSDNWRTWSSKSMTPEWTGEWMVEILSEDGTPLESIIFFIQ